MKRRTFLRTGCSVPLLFVDTVFGCHEPPRHHPVTCKAVFPRYSPYLPIADAKGFFRRNDVSVETRRLDPRRIVATLGEVEIAHLYGAQAVRSLLSETNFKIIATPLDRLHLSLWARHPIKSTEELLGREIAVGLPGSGYSLALATLLKESGLPADVINGITYPGANSRSEALQAGKFDAALFPPSWESRLSRSGLTKVQTITIRFALDVFVVPDRVWEDHRNMKFFVRFLKSITDAIIFLKRKVNQKESIEILSNYGHLPKDVAESVYLIYLPSPVRIESSLESVKAIVRDFEFGSPEHKNRLDELDLEEIVTQKVVHALGLEYSI